MSLRLRPLTLARELAACVRNHLKPSDPPAAPTLQSDPLWKEKTLARTILSVQEPPARRHGDTHRVCFHLSGRKTASLVIESASPLVMRAEGECEATVTTYVSKEGAVPWFDGKPIDAREVTVLFHRLWSRAGIAGQSYEIHREILHPELAEAPPNYVKKDWLELGEIIGRCGYLSG